jgi:chromosome condensin MukBEF ATPase and DNA-binding subunit MukB
MPAYCASRAMGRGEATKAGSGDDVAARSLNVDNQAKAVARLGGSDQRSLERLVQRLGGVKGLCWILVIAMLEDVGVGGVFEEKAQHTTMEDMT